MCDHDLFGCTNRPLMTDAVDKRFRGVSEQHCFKRGVELATLIQKTRHLDSIVARALLVAEFIDSIDPKRTFAVFQRSQVTASQTSPRVGAAFACYIRPTL